MVIIWLREVSSLSVGNYIHAFGSHVSNFHMTSQKGLKCHKCVTCDRDPVMSHDSAPPFGPSPWRPRQGRKRNTYSGPKNCCNVCHFSLVELIAPWKLTPKFVKNLKMYINIPSKDLPIM